MVRRVAALESHEMISEESEESSFTIPPDHCWVLADNEAMAPPDVIDSRAFGERLRWWLRLRFAVAVVRVLVVSRDCDAKQLSLYFCSSCLSL